jgi:hypothetical protein
VSDFVCHDVSKDDLGTHACVLRMRFDAPVNSFGIDPGTREWEREAENIG